MALDRDGHDGQTRYYFRAPWVASRCYQDQNGSFAALSNSKTHEFLTLEDESCEVWRMIETGSYRHELEQLAEKLGVVDCLDDLLNEFEEAQLFLRWADSTSATVNRWTRDCGRPDEPPQPETESGVSQFEDPTTFLLVESEVQERVTAAGGLWTFFWELTYRCNERCIHCFNPGAAHRPNEKSSRKTAELTRTEITCLLDDLMEVGVFRLFLSGGEVLVHKDFFFVMEEARNRGFQVHVYTNGLLLDERSMEKLARFWPDTVSISIYSAEPEKHDAVTRVKGSFERSSAALAMLRAYGIRTNLKAPLMRTTAAGWDQIRAIAQRSSARVVFDSMISAGNDRNPDPLVLNMDLRQVIILAATKGSPLFVGDASNAFGRLSKDSKEPVCGAGVTLMSITPDGNVTPCCALPLQVGTVRSERFRDIWNGRDAAGPPPIVRPQISTLTLDAPSQMNPKTLAAWRSIKLENYEECGTHDRCGWCHKCPGAALNESGNVYSPSEVQCQIATGRMEAARRLAKGMTLAEIRQELED